MNFSFNIIFFTYERLKMKKGDLLIIIAVFLAAIIFGNFVSTGKLDDTKTVIIVRDGKEIHRYRIDENYEKTIRIENEGEINTINIEDGKVSVTEANCHDELCVKSHKISRDGEMIVCLPHKLYVKIEDDSGGMVSEQDVDVIAS